MSRWQKRCPQGHATVREYSETYYCNACGRTYKGDPYDATETEFPVADDDPLPVDIHDEVLEELVQRCRDPTKEYLRAKHFEIGRPYQVGRVLSELEDDGLVEQCGTPSNGYRWAPTDAGEQTVLETKRRAALEDAPERYPQRARGQATPVEAGLATMAVGALLLLGVAIANGVVV